MTSLEGELGPVVVTGGAGFLGSRLLRRLCAAQVPVFALDVRRPACVPSGAKLLEVDLLDAASWRRALERIEAPEQTVLFHLAGFASVAGCHADPGRAVALNVTMAVLAADACRQAGVRRIVFPSTSLVYRAAGDAPLDEDAPVEPRTVYAATKLAAEWMLRGLAASRNLSCEIVRLGNVYGPGGPADTVVGTLLRQALSGDEFTVRTARAVRDFVHCDDVVEGLLRVATAGGDEGARVFNLASGAGSSVRRLITVLSQVSGRPDEVSESAPDAHEALPVLVLSVARLEQRTGWRPRTTLEDGLRSTLTEMRESAA